MTSRITDEQNKTTVNRHRADLRYCEEPQCRVDRPKSAMTQLPDGSWRCIDHAA